VNVLAPKYAQSPTIHPHTHPDSRTPTHLSLVVTTTTTHILVWARSSQHGDEYVDFGNYSDAHHCLRQFYGPWDLTGSPQHFGATSDTAWWATINKITMSTTSTGTNIWAPYMEFRKLFQHSLYLGLGFCSCVGTSGWMRVCFKIQLQQKKIRTDMWRFNRVREWQRGVICSFTDTKQITSHLLTVILS
jgi:hypothetical protein